MNEQLKADILLRTAEGTRALIRGVELAQDNPARAAFLSASAINILADLVDARKTAWVANSALLPLLAASQPLTPSNALVAIAGAVGQWQKAAHPSAPTFVGFASTMVPHLNYMARLVRHRVTTVDKPVTGIYSAVWVAGIVLAVAKSRVHAPAVAVGGAVVASNAALSQNPVLREKAITQGVSHGANLLLASEGLTFAKNLIPAKATLLRQVLKTAESGLFAVGHLLMKDGLETRELERR